MESELDWSNAPKSIMSVNDFRLALVFYYSFMKAEFEEDQARQNLHDQLLDQTSLTQLLKATYGFSKGDLITYFIRNYSLHCKSSPTSAQEEQWNEERWKAVQKAFVDPLVDRKKFISPFLLAAYECCSEWNSPFTTLKAPYLSMLQSSGVGKSRLVISCGEFVYVTYVCLRPPGSTGYPVRSAVSNWFLGDEAKNQTSAAYTNRCSAFINCCADLLQKKLVENSGYTPAEWLADQNWQNGGNEFWGQILDCLKREHKDSKVKKLQALNLDLTVKWSSIFEANRSAWQESLNEIALEKLEKPMLMFVFDEASELANSEIEGYSAFRLLRRSLKLFPSDNNKSFCCATFIDTHSKIIYFSPSYRQDASARLADANMILFRPFWEINSWNNPEIAADEWIDVITSGRVIDGFEQFHQLLFTSGRFLWKSCHESLAKTKEMMRLARAKLLGGMNISVALNKPLSIPDASLVAMLDCRVMLFVCPSSTLSSELISGYMSLCLGVSGDRKTVLSAYSSEPILVEAAASIMNAVGVPKKLIEEILPSLLRSGAVEAGYRGELMMRLVCILAWDCACAISGAIIHSWPMTVCKYLNSLLANADQLLAEQSAPASSSSVAVDRRVSQRLASIGKFAQSTPVLVSSDALQMFMNEGFVFVTHFIQIKQASHITVDSLMQCFLRGAAILCPNCFPGIDAIIPVYLKPQKRLSFIFLQSRNYKQSDSKMSRARRTMSTRNFGFSPLMNEEDPYLIIYFNWGTKQSKTVNLRVHCDADVRQASGKDIKNPFHPQDDQFQLGIGVNGCGLEAFPFLKQLGLENDSFRRLLTASPDPYQLIHSEQMLAKGKNKNAFDYQRAAVGSLMRGIMSYGPISEFNRDESGNQEEQITSPAVAVTPMDIS